MKLSLMHPNLIYPADILLYLKSCRTQNCKKDVPGKIIIQIFFIGNLVTFLSDFPIKGTVFITISIQDLNFQF